MTNHVLITEIETNDKYLVQSSCEEYTLGQIKKTLGNYFIFFPDEFQNLSVSEMKNIVEFMENLNEPN